MKNHANAILLSLALLTSATLFAQTSTEGNDAALKHARELLKSTPLVDGHNDLPWVIRIDPKAPHDVDAYDLRKRTPGDTDLQRLREGQVGAQFWSVYIPGEIKAEGYAKTQLEQIDIAHRIIERYPEALELALTSDDVRRIFKKGKVASLLGMEGGHAIENSLGALRAFYRLGVRYMTLTHNVTLDWADAALDQPKNNGLTAFGKEVVAEMNRLGMLIDLSHVSPKVMSDVLAVSAAPIMYSHSSARALVDHPRNVPDSILTKLSKNGGVVMVTFIPSFVSKEVYEWEKPLEERLRQLIANQEEYNRVREQYAAEYPQPKATLRHVADHLEHVRKVAGLDHVGIGSDYWGSGDMPEGLEDVSKFPNLFAELIRRGWSDADLKKLAGENILRALRQAETVAQRLQKSRPASTMMIEKSEGEKAMK
jgi:membrane dipeptidase